MNQLPVQRASELSIDSAPLTHWLVQGLWSDQAVGILGGEPKCCKSFLALDLAVSVASGAPCLRQFPVRHTGPVLLFPAEDSLAVVRRRLEGISSAAGVGFQSLSVEVITAPTLRLDAPKDRERLSNTVQARYLLGDHVDQLFARIIPTGLTNAGVAWYLTDRLGSVRDLMDSTQTIRDHIQPFEAEIINTIQSQQHV